MPSIKKNKQSYNQARFRRILSSKLNSLNIGKDNDTPTFLKKGNSDMLIYLVYINYINELVTKSRVAGEQGEITLGRLENANEELSKRYRG